MLTSVYYYNLYKPYIMGSRETGSFMPKRGRIADKKETPESKGQVFILNKSLKDEIVRYAQSVSYGVTGMRSSAQQAASDMEDFNRNIHRDGEEAALNWLADDLQDFADRYNENTGFMQSQQHSTGLRTFSYEIADHLYYNRDRISMLGLSLSEDGRVSFDRAHLTGLSQDEANVAIGETIQIFTDFQRHTGALLTEPLSAHMNFKGLGYHYNYKMGAMEADGFGLIETGLLIDKAV